MNNLTKARKILLVVSIAVWLGCELLTGVLYVTDKSDWFQGLAAMLFGVFVVPTVLGLLLGSFEASGGVNRKRLGWSILRALIVLLFRSIVGIIVCLAFGISYFSELVSIIPPWTFGLGAIGFAIAMLVGAAIEAISKAPPTKAPDLLLNLLTTILFVLLLAKVLLAYHWDDGPDYTYIIMALIPCIITSTRVVIKRRFFEAFIGTLAVSVATLLIYVFYGLRVDGTLASIANVFAILPIMLIFFLAASGAKALTSRIKKRGGGDNK